MPDAFMQAFSQIMSAAGGSIGDALKDLVLWAPGVLSMMIMKLMSLVVYLTGAILNNILDYSVVHMSDRILSVTALNDAWGVIRDVANMGFIFVLLYAAISTILGAKGTQKLIVNLVIGAILVNFSMFITKVIIDISNMLSVTFYSAMAPTALNSGHDIFNSGLANSILSPLSIQNLYNSVSLLDGSKLFIIGTVGTIFELIVAFVFITISALFIVRLVVLIFVLILSPIAFGIGLLPALSSYSKRWWNALINQSVFGPVFMILMWVVIMISDSLFKAGNLAAAITGTTGPDGKTMPPSASDVGLVMNFFIVIAMLVAAITIAKQISNSSGKGVDKLTSMVTGGLSGATFGGIGMLGRNTLGRWGAKAAENPDRIKAADAGSRTARLALWAGKKASTASFDARKATIPADVGIGETKLGRTLGLDKARIGVGGIAAGQVGDMGKPAEGGFKAEEDARKKRERDIDKERAEETRKAEAKVDIQKGLADGASDQDIKKMLQRLQKMSDKEIESQKFLTLSNEKVAEALSASQLEAINKSDKFTEDEKRQIMDTHFKKVTEALDKLNDPTFTDPAERAKQETIVRNVSEKELDLVPSDLMDPNSARGGTFITTISQSQADAINKSNKFTAADKENVKTKRAAKLNDAFDSHNYGEAMTLMKKMSPANLVKLDIKKLTEPGILSVYRPALLNKMAAQADLTDEKAAKIREAIMNAATTAGATPEVQEAANWLMAEGLKIF